MKTETLNILGTKYDMWYDRMWRAWMAARRIDVHGITASDNAMTAPTRDLILTSIGIDAASRSA